ncbi:MAG: GrpB-like predicted nucleotidyltransferase (UPF0157 family) [Limisphaerales bacterium]|jgi:GrpB-like predicted nucleotidyltransferase (UPF0157 family)
MPIELEPHNPAWPAIFASAKYELVRNLSQIASVEIEHVGSTAMPNLCAKPIVDILVGVADRAAMVDVGAAIQALNYLPWHSTSERGTFQRRNHLDEPTHQIHVVIHEGSLWVDQIAFRDWLVVNELDRILYENLKISSAAKYSNTQDYSESKSAFVKQILLKSNRFLA